MNELSALIPKFDRMLEMSDSEQRASLTSLADDVAMIGYADRQDAIKVCVEGLREVVSEARR